MLKPADENKGLELLKDVANDPKMDGETVLHRAVAKLSFKDDNDVEVIEHLMKYFPELAKEKRPNSKNCRGQTPVHMAITKGVSKVVTLLLKNLPDSLKPPIFKTKATGTVFRNTVMMAELPLSVAALTTDQDMFKTLLGYWENGAVLDATNSKGDNVCHSLIRLALSLFLSRSLSLSLSYKDIYKNFSKHLY